MVGYITLYGEGLCFDTLVLCVIISSLRTSAFSGLFGPEGVHKCFFGQMYFSDIKDKSSVGLSFHMSAQSVAKCHCKTRWVSM